MDIDSGAAGSHGNSIPAFAAAGNRLIVEHIVETGAWMNRLLGLLEHVDVFFAGLHCPLEELERRERERGNRRIGEARAGFAVTHTFGSYDVKFTSTDDADQLAARLAEAWARRSRPGVFATMLQALRSREA